MVKEYIANKDVAMIKKLTSVLTTKYSVSHNPHSRKGGLIGLAATAIALGKVCRSIILKTKCIGMVWNSAWVFLTHFTLFILGNIHLLLYITIFPIKFLLYFRTKYLL